jgi:hypothetical protein
MGSHGRGSIMRARRMSKGAAGRCRGLCVTGAEPQQVGPYRSLHAFAGALRRIRAGSHREPLH